MTRKLDKWFRYSDTPIKLLKSFFLATVIDSILCQPLRMTLQYMNFSAFTNTKAKLQPSSCESSSRFALTTDDSGSDNSACGLARYKGEAFVLAFCDATIFARRIFRKSATNYRKQLPVILALSGKTNLAVAWRRFLGPWNFAFRQPQNHPKRLPSSLLMIYPPLVIRLEVFSKGTAREKVRKKCKPAQPPSHCLLSRVGFSEERFLSVCACSCKQCERELRQAIIVITFRNDFSIVLRFSEVEKADTRALSQYSKVLSGFGRESCTNLSARKMRAKMKIKVKGFQSAIWTFEGHVLY